jgi:hypothetical protein
MITIKEALEIHSILIEQFGGTKGVRDFNLLESALNRPFQIGQFLQSEKVSISEQSIKNIQPRAFTCQSTPIL